MHFFGFLGLDALGSNSNAHLGWGTLAAGALKMHDRHLGHRIVGHKKVLDVAALQGMSEQHAAWGEVVRTSGAAQDANAVTKAACGTCHRGRYTLEGASHT